MYPVDLNFKMPPEWHPHQCTFMEWPVTEAGWPGDFTEVLAAFANIVKAIAAFEPVKLIVRPELATLARELCADAAKLIEIPNDDSWMRDNGPTFIIDNNGNIGGINWIFNAWGGKFECEKDNLVAPLLLDKLGVKRFDAPFVMEGGSFHTDGEGTLLTTACCLQNQNRNPNMSVEQLEEQLKLYLGVKKIIWIKNGLCSDDTDGHIDNVACFAKPSVVLLQVCDDENDADFESSKDNFDMLKSTLDAKGRKLEVVKIKQPPAQYFEGTRLTLSYINFYFVNGGIVMPVFGGECERADREAYNTISALFPERRVVTVDGRVIARGGGNVHCLTQQMPFGA